MCEQIYIDDLAVGDSFCGASRSVTHQDFMSFADLTGDSHPIHYDPEYAAKSRFGRPVAHGLLLMSWSALGATELSPRLVDSMVAFLEQGCRFTAPVYVGDELVPHFRVAEVEMPKGRASGQVRFAVEIRKVSGEVCLTGYHVYRVRKRDLSAA